MKTIFALYFKNLDFIYPSPEKETKIYLAQIQKFGNIWARIIVTGENERKPGMLKVHYLDFDGKFDENSCPQTEIHITAIRATSDNIVLSPSCLLWIKSINESNFERNTIVRMRNVEDFSIDDFYPNGNGFCAVRPVTRFSCLMKKAELVPLAHKGELEEGCYYQAQIHRNSFPKKGKTKNYKEFHPHSFKVKIKQSFFSVRLDIKDPVLSWKFIWYQLQEIHKKYLLNPQRIKVVRVIEPDENVDIDLFDFPSQERDRNIYVITFPDNINIEAEICELGWVQITENFLPKENLCFFN